jgi:hypothetical protein
MADGKDQRNRFDNESQNDEALNLNDAEVEISLICLRYFRGDWDMYLDYLQGPRVTPEQRRRDLPLVERLRDRDRRTEYLTAFVEDEVMAVCQRLGFDQLLRIWEHCLELDPESEPFPEYRGEGEAGDGERADDAPPTLH